MSKIVVKLNSFAGFGRSCGSRLEMVSFSNFVFCCVSQGQRFNVVLF